MTAFINGFFQALQNLLTWVLDGIVFCIKAAVWFIFDGFLTVIVTFISALDIGSHLTSMAGYFQLLPTQLLYLINAIGLPSGLSILLWSIGIRMAINLVPSWLTRL